MIGLRAGALVLAAVLAATSAVGPAAAPAAARSIDAAGNAAPVADAIPGTPSSVAGASVPDPVTFLPQAPATRRANRPEAVIGFGSRGEPATAAVPRPTTVTPDLVPDPAHQAPAPAADQADTPATPAAGTGPERAPAASTPVVDAAATGTIHGLIRDPSGSLLSFTYARAIGLITPETGGYSYGSYSFDLPPDDYALHFADLYGDHVSGYWCSGPHLCPDIAAATRVTVTAGGSIEVDPILDPLPTISGMLLASDGSPAAGAVVGIDGPWGTQVVQADGTFSARAQPGSHKLFVTPAPNVPGGFYSAAGAGHWTQLAADGTALVVAAGSSVSGLSITLPAYRTISGTLTDTGGSPVGYQLTDLWQGPDQVAWSSGVPDGAFAFQAPSGGSYTLRAAASCPHATVWYRSSAPGYAATQGGSSVITVADQDITGLAIRLPACPQVQGTITSHTGAPLASGYAYATGVDGTSGSAGAVVAANGTFAISLEPGNYILSASDYARVDASGYYTHGGWVLRDADATHLTVGLAGLTGIDLQLPAFRHITGTVTDPDGQPVAGVAMQPWWDGPAYTAADGTYSLKVPPGAWTVSFGATNHTRAGYRGAAGYVAAQGDAVPVSTVAGDAIGIDAVVPFLPRVRGTVTGSVGQPLAGVTVAVITPGNPGYPSVASTTTGADGTYSLFLDPGYTGTFTARAGLTDAYEDVTHDVVLGAGDVNGVDFTLRGFPSVTGTVTDSSGAPLQYIKVWVTSASTGRGATTDAAGHYRVAMPMGPTLDNVTVQFADDYAVHVNGYFGERGFSRTMPATFSLSIDETRVADVVLPTYRYLSGTVRDPDATPVSGATLSSYVDPQGYDAKSFATTSAPGTFTLRLMPGTQYVAVASPTGHASGWIGDGGFNYSAPTAGAFTMPDHDLARDIVLPPVIHLSGRVSTPSPIFDALEVDILLNGAAYTKTWTSSDGNWSADVAPGAYIVGIYDPTRTFSHGWVGVSGFTLDPAAARLITVSTADVTGVNVSLRRNVILKGTVKDTHGKLHASVYTEVWINGRYYDQTWTNGSGGYSLRVPTGTTARVWMYDAYLKVAPGWRTAKGLTANPALAAPTRIGATSVSGVNLVAPAPRFISGTVSATNASGATVTLKKAYVGAIAFGSAASLSIAGTGGKFKVPVLPGTYAVWSDVTGVVAGRPAAYAGGWYRPGGITISASLATRVTPPAAGSTIAIKLAKPAQIGGYLLSSLGTWIDGVVVVVANGVRYDAVATSNSFYAITVPQGTYRVGAYDPFGIYREGWYEESTGFTPSYAGATDVTVVTWGGANVVLALPADSPPPPPAGVTAIPYHRSVVVSWSAPATSPSRPIIHSTVTASPGDLQCSSPGTSCTVTGLDDGTAYTFSVTATTNVGTGKPSPATAPITPLPVPEAPVSPSVEPAGLTPTVIWSASSDNGSAITGYTVMAAPGGATCSAAADATSCRFDPLPEGWYRFSVTASNAQGTGPVSVATAPAPADASPPVVGGPSVGLRSGAPMSAAAVPVLATWSAVDAVSGLASTSLELAPAGGAFVPVTLASPAATSWAGTVAAGSTVWRLRDGATDVLGNSVVTPAVGPSFRVAVTEESGAGTSVSGAWLTQASAAASGGRTRYTKTAGASFWFTFSGRSVAWVSRVSGAGGRAAVYVDGTRVATVSLNRAPVNRFVAWSRTWAGAAKHTVRIVALDQGARLDVDALEVLR